MKKIITIFVIIQSLIFNFQSLKAQAPQAIPYQAVARDSVGNPISNDSISLRFTIRSVTSGGLILYRETHITITNSLGLFAVNIGQGTVVTGTFSTIIWATSSARFLQVEMDTAGGVSYVNMGTQQMLSVPYALHAGSASGAWNLAGNALTTAANFVGTTDNVALNFKVFSQKAGQISSSIIGNTMFGYKSGNAMTGSNNTAFGYQTLLLSTSGNRNTTFGFNALRDNVSGSGNTAIGNQALMLNDGFNNTALGSNSLTSNTFGGENTAIGIDALKSNTTGLFNVAVGQGALINNINGQGNTAVGNYALRDLTDGLYNIAIGNSALGSNISGSTNTAIGVAALYANLSSYNTAVGHSALTFSTTGFGNTSVGTYSMSNSTTGDVNTAIGGDALKSNITGSSNFAGGFGALQLNLTGNENTAIGSQALIGNKSGIRNTAIGYNALSDNDSGSYNIAIGYNANVTAPALTNSTAIGANAIVSASNSMVLGNLANVGIGTSAPTSKLDVIGNTRTTNFQMISGAAANTVLAGDASGNATWMLTSALPLTEVDPQVSSISSGRVPKWNGLTLTDGVIYDDGTKIGIGTTLPYTSIHTIGGVFIDNSGSSHGNTGNPALTVDGNSGDDIIRARDFVASTKFVVQSNGNTGINTSGPLSTFDVNGSFATKLQKSIGTAALTLNNLASVYYVVTAVTMINFPAANTCTNRRYIIVNRSGASRATSNFTNLAGATLSTITSDTSIEIISDGTNWLQIK